MIFCLLLGGIFLIFSIIFALLKDRGAILISGFNTLPKHERTKYDQAAMSRDMRNSNFIYSLIFIVGAVLCHFISDYFIIAPIIIWLVLFLKDCHFDANKAFDKYKL